MCKYIKEEHILHHSYFFFCRLDLDACKSRLRKARSMDGQSSVSRVNTEQILEPVIVKIWIWLPKQAKNLLCSLI